MESPRNISPAIAEHLATRAASLKQLCNHALDNPLGFAPEGWAASEQAVWCMGFSQAFSMVLSYINEGVFPTMKGRV